METISEVLTPFTIFWSIFAIVAVVIIIALMRIVWKTVVEPGYKDYIAALNRINERIDRLSEKDRKAAKEHLAALKKLNAKTG